MNASLLKHWSYLVVLGLMTAWTTAVAEVAGGSAATEPAVTAQEAELLAAARRLAEDSADAAADFLQSRMGKRENAAFYFALGSYRFAAGGAADAEAAFRKALDMLPSYYRARYALAKVLAAQARYADAAAEVVKILDTEADEASKLWLFLGQLWLEAGQPVAAENAFRAVVVRAPDTAAARLGLMHSLIGQYRFQDAAGLARSEILRSPQRREYWSILAHADLQAGNDDKLMTHLECARRLGAVVGDDELLLADLYADRGLPEAAMELYRKTAALENPPVDRLLAATAACLDRNDTDGGTELLAGLDSRLDGFSRDQRARLAELQARLAQQQGDPERARTAYEQALALSSPLNGRLLLRLGELHLAAGRADDAVEVSAHAAGNAEYRFPALVLQARAEVARGGYTRASALLAEALDLRADPGVQRYLHELRLFSERR